MNDYVKRQLSLLVLTFTYVLFTRHTPAATVERIIINLFLFLNLFMANVNCSL